MPPDFFFSFPQNQVHAEVADKEAQINYNNEVYEELQNQLDTMLARITKETEDIKRLEQELREGLFHAGPCQCSLRKTKSCF